MRRFFTISYSTGLLRNRKAILAILAVPPQTLRRAVPSRHTLHSPYSQHPVARLYRSWRRFAHDDAAADILLLPLTGLTVSLFVIEFVPGASEAIATAFLGPLIP